MAVPSPQASSRRLVPPAAQRAASSHHKMAARTGHPHSGDHTGWPMAAQQAGGPGTLTLVAMRAGSPWRPSRLAGRAPSLWRPRGLAARLLLERVVAGVLPMVHRQVVDEPTGIENPWEQPFKN